MFPIGLNLYGSGKFIRQATARDASPRGGGAVSNPGTLHVEGDRGHRLSGPQYPSLRVKHAHGGYITIG